MPDIEIWRWAGITHTADATTGKVVLEAGDRELGHRDLTHIEREAMRAGTSIARRVLLRWHEGMRLEQESALLWLADPQRHGAPPYRETVEILRAKGLVEGPATVPGSAHTEIGQLALRLTSAGEAAAAEVRAAGPWKG